MEIYKGIPFLPTPSPLLPNFLLTLGVLLRSPAFSLACSISAWKRKGNLSLLHPNTVDVLGVILSCDAINSKMLV